jgi:SAM-dependent methyltransferase
MNVFVTVGMSRWPFDRLLRAVASFCSDHPVFAQTGMSTVRPPCANSRFLPYDEWMARAAAADVVITHAGNSVRLVQRLGKVPIAVPRMARHSEMPNDHQVAYLRREQRVGRVVAAWDVEALPTMIAEHPDAERRLVSERPLPPPADGNAVADLIDRLWHNVAANPFNAHPLQRYCYAWGRLAGRTGEHLDLGFGDGVFLTALADTSKLRCTGADPHPPSVERLRAVAPALPVVRLQVGCPLPFDDESFDSVSLLDVLEHCPDEAELLREVFRILRPGGLLVVSVPRLHLFSWLDPDNVKFVTPRLHRQIYSARFGDDVYRERFLDLSDGLFGDMSVGRRRHTNYRRQRIRELLESAGFTVVDVSGANLFWRLFHTPSLLARGRLRALLERAIALDGRAFSTANLFMTVVRPR